MKRSRLFLSLLVLLVVLGIGGATASQSASADASDGACDCRYVQSGQFGVQRWWYGTYTCHVEDCWLPIGP